MSEVEWRAERVLGFGRAVGGPARVAHPRDLAALRRSLAEPPRDRGVALRGSGCSYGDAATNSGGRVVALDGIDRILDWNPSTGIARVEPGVTIRKLWRHTIADGWWPAVVPGTMAVSVGGAAAMNIHGKNNFAVGSFGEHVRSFRLMTPDGRIQACDRERDGELFHAAIGGFGMLGCFTEIELQLRRVHSGRLRVWARPTRTLEESLEVLEQQRSEADYLVGWLDLHSRGAALGRGILHRADHLREGEDPSGVELLSPSRQDVPSRLFGVVPNGWIWPFMWCAGKAGLVPLVNALQYRSGFAAARRSPYLQTHGAFHFLLDYVPRWHWAFRPGGLIQFQPFVPIGAAARTLRSLIERCQQCGLEPYLGVLKRHRPDPFLMSPAVDGFSLAMDFAVPTARSGRERLWAHTRELADVVLDAGGRFYYAKDATLPESSFARIHGGDAVARFRALKRRCDPDGRLQTDLSRRLLG